MSMSDQWPTCEECGGSGVVQGRCPDPHFLGSCTVAHVELCPDCVAGRVPSDEAVGAASRIIAVINGGVVDDRAVARTALLAVMRLAREENL